MPVLKHGGYEIKKRNNLNKEIKARSFLGRPLCRDELSIPYDVNIGTNIDKSYQLIL